MGVWHVFMCVRSLCVVCASIHVGWLVSHLRKRVNATGIRFVGFAHEVVKQIVGVDTARVRSPVVRSTALVPTNPVPRGTRRFRYGGSAPYRQ